MTTVPHLGEQEELPLDAPEDEHYQTEPEPEQPREYQDTTLWKKWSVFGGKGRFLTIRPWLEAAKVAIDIGETGEGSALVGHSLVWANILQLTAYLQAVSSGRAGAIYKMNTKAGVPTDEGFAHYGGAIIEGQDVSRIFKIHHWQQEKDKYDPSAFVWKCGHFKGHKSKTGAFIPDMRAPISMHSIKVSRQEMNEITLALTLALTNHAARTETIKWLEEISGRSKK